MKIYYVGGKAQTTPCEAYNGFATLAVESEKIAMLESQISILRRTLQGLVNADYRDWDDGWNTPEEFVRWAKSRSQHALDLTSP